MVIVFETNAENGNSLDHGVAESSLGGDRVEGAAAVQHRMCEPQAGDLDRRTVVGASTLIGAPPRQPSRSPIDRRERPAHLRKV